MDTIVTIQLNDKSCMITSNLPSLEEDKKFLEKLLENWEIIDFHRGFSHSSQ